MGTAQDLFAVMLKGAAGLDAVDLTVGRQRLEFPGVSAQIRPETVSLSANGLSIVEQNFDFDLLITPFHTLRTKEQWSGILRALADVKGRRAKVADIDGDVLVRDVGVSMSASVTGAADVSIDMEAAW